jgi:AcrR family transcriptional regulator
MSEQAPVSRRRGRPRATDQGDVGRSGLIEAAKVIFASQDPITINRRTFAEMAGVDPNLIRYYFGDMNRLMAEVLADNHNLARSQMQESKEADGPEERLRFRVARTFQLFRDQPNHHQMVRAVLYGHAGTKDHEEWESLLSDSVTDLEDILQEGVRQGRMRTVDPAALHLLIIAACEFWTTNSPVIAILFPRKKPGSRLDKYFVTFMQDLILNALRPLESVSRSAE